MTNCQHLRTKKELLGPNKCLDCPAVFPHPSEQTVAWSWYEPGDAGGENGGYKFSFNKPNEGNQVQDVRELIVKPTDNNQISRTELSAKARDGRELNLMEFAYSLGWLDRADANALRAAEKIAYLEQKLALIVKPADPQTILALLADHARLVAENERLVDALKEIAADDQEAMYQTCFDCDYPKICSSNSVCKSMPRSDIGKLAIAALSTIGGDQ